MATVAMQPPELTEQQYLDMERVSPVKHEYVAGRVFAMTGTSDVHNLIVGSLYMALRNHLRGSPCRVFMADLKLRVRPAGAYYYPDLMVSCEPVTDRHYREQPILVVEVLSESTAGYDAGDKRRAYQTLESLQEYVLISQECMDVRIYRRHETGWQMSIYTDGATIPFRSVALELPIEQLYEEAWT